MYQENEEFSIRGRSLVCSEFIENKAFILSRHIGNITYRVFRNDVST